MSRTCQWELAICPLSSKLTPIAFRAVHASGETHGDTGKAYPIEPVSADDADSCSLLMSATYHSDALLTHASYLIIVKDLHNEIKKVRGDAIAQRLETALGKA